MFLLKLPFRAAAIPLLIALLAVRVASALITSLSSIVTNTICTLSFSVAAADREKYGYLRVRAYARDGAEEIIFSQPMMLT